MPRDIKHHDKDREILHSGGYRQGRGTVKAGSYRAEGWGYGRIRVGAGKRGKGKCPRG